MIELEIQALSQSREGLLVDVGRAVLASGFSVQRQRLVQDPHGVLITLVVCGPARKQRALEAALEGHERIISFNTAPFEEGPPKPHFAASRTFAREAVAPPPAPVVKAEPAAAPAAAAAVATDKPVETPESKATVESPVMPQPKQEVQAEPEPEFFFIPTRPPAPAPAPVAIEPYVEVIQLGPDVDAVEKVLPKLTNGYPQIFPLLLALERSVADAARESTLQLAGQRIGEWVFERDYAHESRLDVDEAMTRIGVPALSAFAQVEYRGGQLHIRDSQLCAEGGHSGCRFFDGYLEGLIGRITSSRNLSIFAVCCRSYGADACVLAISN
ncbi:hypothetical protein [Dyella psychrodurans]|uniref:4-vinyl reductase 4VR domain-containing protein n=1 Tax=Dyella psychrodurans TaxID=1927960 RepID=A0A370X0U2_9GAMM|nr:hypothetical protein [Dyella psychrodurans]RDS82019.1 hypothetical protein DWU99_16570 [Dyella psychrodurans]